jgi:hypothetical protein
MCDLKLSAKQEENEKHKPDGTQDDEESYVVVYCGLDPGLEGELPCHLILLDYR